MASITGGYNSSSMSNQFQNQTAGTSATTATKSPYQTAIQPDIFATLHQYLSDPQAAVNPARLAARNQVNQNYSGLADRLRNTFLTTGGGKSGKMGQAQLQGELGRSGALADVDNSAAVQASQLPMTAAQLAEAFLGINMGQSTTGNQTSSGTSSGQSSGWNIGAKVGFDPSGMFGAGGDGTNASNSSIGQQYARGW